MRRVRPLLALVPIVIAGMSLAGAASENPKLGDARLEPVSFADLPGWGQDDHAAAFSAFRRSCGIVLGEKPPLRPAKEPENALVPACRAAIALSEPGRAGARRYFETYFEPFRIVPPAGEGFLTGYYEPEFEGSRVKTESFQVPLLARPDDLVTVPQGATWPGLDPALQAARRTAAGYEPYPERGAIEDGALGEAARALVHLREPGEAFILHVQGSGRIRLADGSFMRLAYAGRNGQPYTSIGRILVERAVIALNDMSLEWLMGWLRDHPDEARALMRLNRSYIFFREATELSISDGPIGGAGVALAAGRSLAIDRTWWSYGLPFWLEGTMPLAGGGSEPLRRLMIAQDTGSAILGPARGDFYVGSGPAAGTVAGLMRHRTRFVVLRPRAAPPAQ